MHSCGHHIYMKICCALVSGDGWTDICEKTFSSLAGANGSILPQYANINYSVTIHFANPQSRPEVITNFIHFHFSKSSETRQIFTAGQVDHCLVFLVTWNLPSNFEHGLYMALLPSMSSTTKIVKCW